jgi:hypothetical protein
MSGSFRLTTSALEDAMWVPTQDEAIVMFARFLKARYGTAASVVVRNTAKKLQDEGDLEGQKIWNAVADAEDHRGLGWPQPQLLDRDRAA